MSNIEPRKNFYANEMNYQRMDNQLNEVISNLTLKEVLKMIREISYDMVCYYDEYNKGIIYQSESYSQKNREQACQLQRLLSTACDLFAQSVIEKREFDENYLEQWTSGGALQLRISNLEDEVKKYKDMINNLKEELENENN